MVSERGVKSKWRMNGVEKIGDREVLCLTHLGVEKISVLATLTHQRAGARENGGSHIPAIIILSMPRPPSPQ